MQTLCDLLLCLLPLAQAQAAEPKALTQAQRLEQLERELESRRVSMHIPGMAIAVVHGDKVILARGFGLADIEQQRAVTPETIFAIGSSTKAFTATLVGTLVDEGRLTWDEPIKLVLPEFDLRVKSSEADATPTLRDLLSHRTGFARADLLWASGRVEPAIVLATAARAEPWTGFRQEFIYNNIMFLAAGEAAAVVAEKPWAELLRARILEPLGMHSTTLTVAAAQADERLALGYMWDGDKHTWEHQPMRALDCIAPAGGINSNVLDMAQWLRLQLGRGEFEGRRLISAEALRATWTEQISVGGGAGYGLGWFLRTWKGQPVVEHGGNIDGFAAQVGLLPDSDLGFVLLTNVSATALQGGSLELVWESLLGAVREDAAAVDHAPYLGEYKADFATFQDVTFKVLEQDGKLAVDVPGQMVYALREPDERGRWIFELTDQIAVSFDLDADGRAIGMHMYQSGLTFELPRRGVENAVEIDLEAARRFLGEYEHPAFKTPLRILIRNNRLAVDIPKQMICELHAPDAERKRVLRVNDTIAVRFEEDPDGEVEGLTFFERGAPFDCPRIPADPTQPADSLITLAALHRLRASGARGDALAALGTWRMTGLLRMVHMGIEGRLELLAEGPERFLMRSDLEPFATVVVGHDRGLAASDSNISTYHELTGELLEFTRADHPAESFGDWSAWFERVEVLRAEERDGRDHWVVRLRAGESFAITAWVDAKTGDTVREEFQEPMPGGEGQLSKTRTYSDFREFEGLRMPYRMASEDPFSGRVEFEVETVEAHLQVADDAFRVRRN